MLLRRITTDSASKFSTHAILQPFTLSFVKLSTFDFLVLPLQRTISQNTLVHGTEHDNPSNSSLDISDITVAIEESRKIFNSTTCSILSLLFQMHKSARFFPNAFFTDFPSISLYITSLATSPW